MDNDATRRARELMDEFAEVTGLLGATAERRYLWTDAYAVCNFLGLYQSLGDSEYLNLALTLVDRVHQNLGKFREDQAETGWISRLSEAEGDARPTAGGLRIGKPLPERAVDEPLVDRDEWDRDGQYYHYLTKWMHALRQVGLVTGDSKYQRWAVDLALAAHRGFIVPQGPRRLYWKMNTTLEYPLVTSMGQHDPLDGFVTFVVLHAGCSSQVPGNAEEEQSVALRKAIQELAEICDNGSWVTDDSLGIGGLLFDAVRMLQIDPSDRPSRMTELMLSVLTSIETSLHLYFRMEPLRLPATQRLAFRELGLSIGLKAVDLMYQSRPDPGFVLILDRLQRYTAIGESIDAFWLETRHRLTPAWRDHADINNVMLATSLLPDFALRIRPVTLCE